MKKPSARNQRMRVTDLCVDGEGVDDKIEMLLGKLRIGFREVYERIAEVEGCMKRFDSITHPSNRATAGERELEHELEALPAADLELRSQMQDLILWGEIYEGQF